jgi:hypothetical protein
MNIRLFTQAILCRQLQLTDKLETTVKALATAFGAKAKVSQFPFIR